MTPTAPLPAATVLVVRASLAPTSPAGEVEVLLVRRSHRASFMANAFVFPGGRVDAADAVQSPGSVDQASGAPAGPAMAIRRAAARELAEEVGLQVTDLRELVPFAHWITPAAEPKRFDTEFFLWALPPPGPSATAGLAGGAEVKVDGREVFDPLWLTPAAALHRYAEGSLNLPPPTVCTLEDLAAEIAAARSAVGGQGLLATLLTHCAVRRPLPALPKLYADSDGGLAIVMPWDPDYALLPGEGSPAAALAEGATSVPRRIRRCQLKLGSLGLGPALAKPPREARQTAEASPADAGKIAWTVERLPS